MTTICEGCPESKILMDGYPAEAVPDLNSDTCRKCMERQLAKARAEGTREYLCSERDVKLHCPTCGGECPSFNNIINRSKLVYCPKCNFEFEIIARPCDTLRQLEAEYREALENLIADYREAYPDGKENAKCMTTEEWLRLHGIDNDHNREQRKKEMKEMENENKQTDRQEESA